MRKEDIKDLMYLIGCDLNNLKPDSDRISSMDLTEIYLLSKRHQLGAYCYLILEKADAFKDDDFELKIKWRELKDKTLERGRRLEEAKKKLYELFDYREIWYVPLISDVIKNLYPNALIRDNFCTDLLVDPIYRKVVKEHFVHHGYMAGSYENDAKDVYDKSFIYSFEIITSLSKQSNDFIWREYYSDIQNKLVRDENNKFEFHFSAEDFYVYLLANALSNFENMENELMFFTDIYLYRKKYEAEMDMLYVKAELKKLGAYAFENEIYTLAKGLLENDDSYDMDYLLEEFAKSIFFPFTEERAICGVL